MVLAASLPMLATTFAMSSASLTVPIMHFISFEVGYLTGASRRFRLLADLWHWSFVAAMRIVMIIDMALEVFRAVIPGAGANEHPVTKPFWAIVSVRSTPIRSVVIVAVRTFRGWPYVDIDLSLYFRSGYREADSSNSSYHKKFA